LTPWEEPPCWADEDDPHPADRVAQTLLKKMLAKGISRYNPDPLAALDENRSVYVRQANNDRKF
jgi:hypothetical protein